MTRNIARRDLENPIMDYKSMDELQKLGGLINSAMNKHREASVHDIRAIKNEDLSLLKLKGSNEDWTITFDATTDITTIHDKDLNIIRANRAFYDAYNIDEKQLNKCNEILYGADQVLA